MLYEVDCSTVSFGLHLYGYLSSNNATDLQTCWNLRLDTDFTLTILLFDLPQITDHWPHLPTQTVKHWLVGSVKVSICYLLIEHRGFKTGWPLTTPIFGLLLKSVTPPLFSLSACFIRLKAPWDGSILKIRVEQTWSSVWTRNGSHPFWPFPPINQ